MYLASNLRVRTSAVSWAVAMTMAAAIAAAAAKTLRKVLTRALILVMAGSKMLANEIDRSIDRIPEFMEGEADRGVQDVVKVIN